MPARKTILATNQIYHLFNRGVDKRITFQTAEDYQRALFTIWFYSFQDLPCKLSYLLTRNQVAQKEYIENISRKKKLVEIYCYCLMPNHFHLLIKQKAKNGIVIFMRNFEDSFVKYFNLKNDRKGTLFMGRFKDRLIETDEQFLHVSRYIHLNPYVSSVVSSFRDLQKYPWCSLGEYLKFHDTSICNKKFLKKYMSLIDYQIFLKDHADYARSLELIKHQIFE